MRTFISGGTLVRPDETLFEHTLVIKGSCVSTIEARRGRVAGPGERLIDAHDLWVIPGLIDVHVHGSSGYDVMDATPQAMGPAVHKGRLAPGLDADVVLLDAGLDMRLTLVAGEVVTRNLP